MDAGLALVTGADGFIGSHLVDRLVEDGHPVRRFRRGSPPPDPAEAGPADSRFGDLRDPASVQAAMEGVGTVFHLGGIASAGAAMAAPAEAVAVNTVGTLNVLEAARAAGVRRVVLMSSGHVFGPPRQLPVTEDHPLDPATPYAASKLAADKLAMGYHRSYGLPVVVVRPFNVYGPRQSSDAVVPTIVGQALAGGPVRVRSLAPRRDFVFVSDVVEALILAATAERAVGREIILASGRAVSVAAILHRVLALAGAPNGAPPKPAAPAAPARGDDRIFGDPSLAGALLGWSARVPLDEGLARTVAWWREHRPCAAAVEA